MILREHRSVARTFTAKLCPDVSGLSCAMVVNTGWRLAGGWAMFIAEWLLRPKFVFGWAKILAEKSLLPRSRRAAIRAHRHVTLRAPQWAQSDSLQSGCHKILQKESR